MSHQRGGYGLTATARRTSHEDVVPAGSSFSELRANPARGSFVMPSSAVLLIYAPCGNSSTSPLATLTTPDGNVREIPSPGLNPGGRTTINGVIAKGTHVAVGAGLEVQVGGAPLEWHTIARG